MKKSKIIITSLLAILLVGCSDVFEEDISNETVALIYPINGAVVYSNVVDFQWMEVDDASQYQLQVSDSQGALVLDSIIQTNSFKYSLSPDDYQWRVKAENFGYATDFSTFADFTLGITTDLSQQEVLLNTPSDGIYVNDVSNLVLDWRSLSAATTYKLVIEKDLNGWQTIVNETNLTQTTYAPSNILFGDDAIYKWRVLAQNGVSETPYSERIFYLDRTNPNEPQLLLPDDNTTLTVSTTISFIWQSVNDVGNIQSPITYYIYMATDSNFSHIIGQVSTQNNEVTYTLTSSGTYYWHVVSIDEAGNSSTSATRTIIIN